MGGQEVISMEKYKVGIIGGTGMVGQRFVTLMENHPWFQLTVIAASPRSAGKRYEDAVALYGKYIGNWGGECTRWRFEAMVRGKCVKSITRSASAKLHLEVRPSAQRLCIGDTYDMAAVRIRILDEWDGVASYAQLPVSFVADGNVALLGPDAATAEGGMCGTYVRTTGRTGPGILVVSAPGLEPVTGEFAVSSNHIQALPQGNDQLMAR